MNPSGVRDEAAGRFVALGSWTPRRAAPSAGSVRSSGGHDSEVAEVTMLRYRRSVPPPERGSAILMRPALGWAGLSRSALKRAEAQLVADSEGVRDEVGVLALHTAYANRFFPGTSVQQTPAPVCVLRSLADHDAATWPGAGPIRSGAPCARTGGAESREASPRRRWRGGRSAGGRRRSGVRSRSRRLSRIGSRWVRGAFSAPAPTATRLLVASSLPAGEVGPKVIAAGRRPTTRGVRWRRHGPCFIKGYPNLRPTSIMINRSTSSSCPANGNSCANACSTRGVPETADPPSCRRWCEQEAASGTISIPGRDPYTGTRTRRTERRCFGPVTLPHWRRSRGPSTPPRWKHAASAMMARPLGSDTETILPRSLTSMAAPLSG